MEKEPDSAGLSVSIEERLGSFLDSLRNMALRILGSGRLRVIREKRTAIGIAWKLAIMIGGLVILFLSSLSTIIMASQYGFGFFSQAGNALLAISSASLVLTAFIVVSSLPDSLRIRFFRARVRGKENPTYGFITMLAVGVGSTLGSPLFVLIPENVKQYAMASIISLILATVLSIGLALVFSEEYRFSITNKLDIVGGSNFVRHSAGTMSVRYFITRFSGWVANTALAAYSAILFALFDFDMLPGVLSEYGLGSPIITGIQYLILAMLVIWFIVNAFPHGGLLKIIGRAQVVMVVVMYLALIAGTFTLGLSASPSNIPSHYGGYGFLPAVIINTGYLYIIFFGFQEILTLNREARKSSTIPFSRFIGIKGEVPREKFIPISILLTVLLSAAVNIAFALVVLMLPVTSAQVDSAVIPALYLMHRFAGHSWEVVISIVFLIASVTTFVPAFLSASRHLGSMAEDGFFPKIFSSLSWLFTLLFLFILIIVRRSLLISITDFMILISLALISFSSIWMHRKKVSEYGRYQFLAIIVGFACLVSSAAIFFIEPTVVLFGVIAILATYLIYDIFELGNLGSKIFLAFFMLMEAAFIPLFTYGSYYAGNSWYGALAVAIFSNGFWLEIMLFISSMILVGDVLFEILYAGTTDLRVKI